MTRRLPTISPARRAVVLAGFAAVLAAVAAAPSATRAGETAVKIAPPAVDTTTGASGLQTAVFAGGCFWGVQGVFQRVGGVVQAALAGDGAWLGTALPAAA